MCAHISFFCSVWGPGYCPSSIPERVDCVAIIRVDPDSNYATTNYLKDVRLLRV